VALSMHHSTAQTRAEDDAVAHFASIVMHARDAIISKTLDGIVVSWNPAAERMFGYSAAEIIGQSIVTIIPPERRHEEDEILGRLRRGDVIDHFETERVRKDGQRIPISLTISPIRRADGAIIGASKIARDISEKKRIEQERDLLLLREQEARAEAEAANRAKDDFLAVLSHELRTPLATIVTGARVLRNITRHDDTANRTREAIERQASHLSAMLDDLLDFKRIVSRTIVLDPRPCDLGEVVRECMTALKETGRFKDHALAVDLKPVQVNADVVRLNQVLVNLIGNALKYTPPGGSIRVSVKEEGTDAVVRVEDTGIGIHADALSRIFELFVQGDTVTGRVRSGLGVGLAVVRHLVELHGGTVHASSGGRGKGSTFAVRLPRLEGSASLSTTGP
jgi:PAS domain S-box-containing protein